MGKEIEHKYIVTDESYKESAEFCHRIIQGYLSKDPCRVVRVRLYDNQGFLTVKGITCGDAREEYEFPISEEDARGMLCMCIGHPVEKLRWIYPYCGFNWEIDEFIYPPIGTIAEIELKESGHDYSLPPFIGEEVTGKPEYYNSNL